jgi:CheY-like chemotaxis protein
LIAVEKIRQNNYDLILMDLHMPEMNGFEAVQAVRNLGEEKFKLLPIIALTASVLDGSSEEILSSGMNGYVMKPFSPDDLYKVIKPYLEKAQKKKEPNA